ncbi:MAG: D-alanine--D-alanine ligase, partial [Nitrospira sp.]|nr:D-alanine--D-alanine ligase [Nitrospira sp.]
MITEKRIGVLMGGISSERDISLKSGNLVASSLKRLGYEVVPVDMGIDLPAKIEDWCIEAAFIALHGRYGEDGCVQGLLEIMGIPYTGSGLAASAICMDKLLSKKMFEYYNIPTPEYTVYCADSVTDTGSLTYPVVVKPCREGSTIGISMVSEKEGLQEAIEKALNYGDKVIIEEYISGTEVTAGILDNKPLPLVEITPRSGFYDFTTKTSKGM